MSGLVYHIVKAWLWLWSLLPLWLLHLQSSFVAFLLHRVFGYRKKIILDNLQKAFPEKSEQELKQIRARFYQNFCDVFFEMLKQLSISPQALKKRMLHLNPEVISDMVAHGKGGIAVFGHYTNWEWLGAGMGLHLPFPTVGVYKPLSNKIFDRLTFHIRTRLGNDMIPQEKTYRESLRRLKEPCYIAFLGDQTPLRYDKLYFSSFMGRPAATHLGIATIALKLGCPLWYFDTQRVRRGYYEVTLREIPFDDLNPKDPHSVYTLTDRHVAMLETAIRKQPANWLWSHRRWKRKSREGDIFSKALVVEN